MRSHVRFPLVFLFFTVVILSGACSKKSSDRDSGGTTTVKTPSKAAIQPSDSPSSLLDVAVDPAAILGPSSVEVEDATSMTITNELVHVEITNALIATLPFDSTSTNTETNDQECASMGSFWIWNEALKKCQNQLLQVGHTYYIMSADTGSCITSKQQDPQKNQQVSMLEPCKLNYDILYWTFSLESNNSFSIRTITNDCLQPLAKGLPTPLTTETACSTWAGHFRIRASSATADPNKTIVPVSLVTDTGLCLSHPLVSTDPTAPVIPQLINGACEGYSWLLLDTLLNPTDYFAYLGSGYSNKTKYTNTFYGVDKKLDSWMKALPFDCGTDSLESITFSYDRASYVCGSSRLNTSICKPSVPTDCMEYPVGSTSYVGSSIFTYDINGKIYADTTKKEEKLLKYACEAPQRLTAFGYQACSSDETDKRRRIFSRCCSSVGDDNRIENYTDHLVTLYGPAAWCKDTTGTAWGQVCIQNELTIDSLWLTLKTFSLTRPFVMDTISCSPGEYMRSFSINMNKDNINQYDIRFQCGRH